MFAIFCLSLMLSPYQRYQTTNFLSTEVSKLSLANAELAEEISTLSLVKTKLEAEIADLRKDLISAETAKVNELAEQVTELLEDNRKLKVELASLPKQKCTFF